MLTHEYELFHMKENEKIYEIFERLFVIVNNLNVIGKSYSNKDLLRKALRRLTKYGCLKSQEYKKEETLAYSLCDELSGNLIAYEATHLKNEMGDKKKKGIAHTFRRR